MLLFPILTAAPVTEDTAIALLVCLAIGLIVGLITVLSMRSQLKSVRPKNAAGEYIVQGSFHLRHSRDIFLYRNVTRTPRPKRNK